MSGKKSTGRFAYDGLDRAMHEKARLGLLTCLAGSADGLTFGELKELCGLTDGNLNRHLNHLSEAKLVRVDRIEGRGRPQTVCTLTPAGRKKFTDYLDELQRVLDDAQSRMVSERNQSRLDGRLSPEN